MPPSTSAAPETSAVAQLAAPTWRAQAEAFLQQYSAAYQRLYTQSSEAEWRSNTRIVAGDTTNAAATARTNQMLAAFTGSTENITRLRELLEHKSGLSELQMQQLQAALFTTANSPQIITEVVTRRIKAETAQVEKLHGFDCK